MTRLIVTLLIAGLIAGGMAWIAATPGGVILTIGTYQAQMSVGIAFVLLLAAAFVLMLVLKVLWFVLRIPRLFRSGKKDKAKNDKKIPVAKEPEPVAEPLPASLDPTRIDLP